MTPFDGPGLSRRGFVRLSASGLAASFFLDSPAKALAPAATAGVFPRGSAKNVIFVSLGGSPSQIDTFDFKEGSWTPPDFAPETYLNGALRFPRGLLPRLAERIPDLVFVRSCQSWALVHGLAQTWSQIARNPTGALGSVSPHIGAVVSLELAQRRDPARDLLPTFLALNATQLTGSGYLPASYGPFSLLPSPGGIGAISHPDGVDRFRSRWRALVGLDEAARQGEGPLGKDGSDFAVFQEQARAFTESRDVAALFAFTEADLAPWGATSFGASCLIAKKVLAARRGARFVQLSLDGWDHHARIYEDSGLRRTCAELDPALGTLLGELATTAGEDPGRTLLDETLVVVAGEFGRTTGALNTQGGRDHHLRYTTLVAGGGVAGGRVLGATSASGETLVESGWSGNRDIRPEDVAATMYSALGIDWTTSRGDDPFGRGFEYIPYARDGVYRPVDELFKGPKQAPSGPAGSPRHR